MMWGLVGGIAAIGLVAALWWARRTGATEDSGPNSGDEAVLLDAANRALRNERYADAAAMFRRAGRINEADDALARSREHLEPQRPDHSFSDAADPGPSRRPSREAMEAFTEETDEPARLAIAPPDADEHDRAAAKTEAQRLYAAGDAHAAIALLKKAGDTVTLAKVLAAEGRRDEAKRALSALTPSAFRFRRTQELLAQLHREDGDLEAASATLDALVKYAKQQPVADPRLETWEQSLRRLHSERQAPMLGQAPKRRYVLKRLLGEGGNAEVHLARDTTLERDVAFKMLGAQQAAADPVYMKWFEREAKLGSRLNHPNVVTVFDFGTYEGRAFIAMEFVEGDTLRQRLAQRPDWFKPAEVLRWIEETCEGLGYAHANGLIHRDIKLDNLMIDKMGRIKVLDFGLVKAASDETQTAVISGTPSYMAPELLLGRRADERSDIYAMGAVAFALLTGQMPYGEPDIFAKHVNAPIPSARTIVPALPKTADSFFSIALAKKPEERFQSMASFADAFKRACADGKPPRRVPITSVQR